MAQPSMKLTNGALDVQVLSAAAAGTENGLVVRTIPSSTLGQFVTGSAGATLALDSTVGGVTTALTNKSAAFKLTDGTNLAKLTQVGATYALDVNVVASAGDTIVDGAAFTAGTSYLTPVGGVFDDSIAAVSVNGKQVVARLTSFRAIHVHLRDNAGVALGTAGNKLVVDGSGVTQPVSGTITANIGTVNGLALDATLTGGTQKTRLTDGTNNATITAGGSLNANVTNTVTVSGTVALSAGAAAIGSITNTGFNLTGVVKGTSSALNATVKSVDANTNALDVAVNGSVVLGTGASVIGSISNTAFTANIGTTNGLALDATLTGGTAKVKLWDGTNNASVTAGGSLNVNITGGASSATSVDNTAFTAGSSTVSTISGVAFTGVPTAATTGNQAALALTTFRSAHVSLRDTSGVALGITSGALNINISSGSIANTSFIATQAAPGVHANYFWNRLTDGTNDVVVSATGAIKVDGSAVTQPVSGTVAVTGVATAANQTNGTQLAQISNGTNQAAVKNVAPSYNDYALITRNIDAAASYVHYGANQIITNVKASAGLLKSVVINTPGDTGATLTIYDTATTTTTVVVASINLSVNPTTLSYGLALTAGIAIVITGVSTACDVTLLYA